MTKILRPAVLPDNKKMFAIPVIAGLAVSAMGLASGSMSVIVVPLIVIAVFPGLPVFFHLIFFLGVKFEIYDDRLIVSDYIGDKFVKVLRHQEMSFDEIACVYYLEKEVNILLNLRKKIKKYKVRSAETDYTPQHLIAEYGVDKDTIDSFEKSNQKLLNDYTATAVLLKLDEIYDKYNVDKDTQRRIDKALKDDSNFNSGHVLDSLKAYLLNNEDIESIKDEFANLNADVLQPFLRTKLNVVKYKKIENRRHGMAVTARTDIALVLSNIDGTKKAYLMHFHDLSIDNARLLAKTMAQRNTSARFLMTKKQKNHLIAV